MFNGITLGSTYALIAIGYTMVYGIIGMINFAHGQIYMIGSYVSFMIIAALMMMDIDSSWLLIAAGFVGAIITASAYGWSIERVAYRPVRSSKRLIALISAIGMSIFLQNYVSLTEGSRVMAGVFMGVQLELNGTKLMVDNAADIRSERLRGVPLSGGAVGAVRDKPLATYAAGPRARALSARNFTFAESAFVLAIVVLGGMGSQFAVILAAIFLVVSRELMHDFNEYSMLLLGGLMVLMMRFGGLLAVNNVALELLPQ